MQISQELLVDFYKFFKTFIPEDTQTLSICSTARSNNEDVLILRIMRMSTNIESATSIVCLKPTEDSIVIVPEDSDIDKYMAGKIYGYEKELYDLFGAEGKFLLNARNIHGNDMLIEYINYDQNFEEKYSITGSNVMVESTIHEELKVDFDEGGEEK